MKSRSEISTSLMEIGFDEDGNLVLAWSEKTIELLRSKLMPEEFQMLFNDVQDAQQTFTRHFLCKKGRIT